MLRTWKPRLCLARAALVVLLGAMGSPTHADSFAAERAEMVRAMETYARQMDGVPGYEGLSPSVVDAMRTVPRHEFVPERVRRLAYRDRPLPIGSGQTISQPFMVALMTSLLNPEPGDVILEVGTGSGYQAAVLARLVRRVHTIEIVPALAQQAESTLTRLGYDNVSVRGGDGYRGWPEAGPFDGIMVTAAADHVPPLLLGQLKPGARLVMPVGDAGAVQSLTLIEVDERGEVQVGKLLPVRFVPLTRER